MTDYKTAHDKIGGLKGLMRLLGEAPAHEHKWKNMDKCPFCGAKGKASVYTSKKNGGEYFKCYASGCNSGGRSMADVDYLGARRGLSTDKPANGGASPAYEEYLKLAGLWEDRPAAKVAKPLSSKPTPAPPNPASEPATENPPPLVPPEKSEPVELEKPTKQEGDSDDILMLKAIDVLRSEGKASTALLQRSLKVGFNRAARIMDELQKRGVVGPENGSQPRDILKLPETKRYIVLKIGEDYSFEPVNAGKPQEEKPTAPPPPPHVDVDQVHPATEGTPSAAAEDSPARAAIEKFYFQLGLSPLDTNLLFEKRGLLSDTCRRLGFVSSPFENKEKLEGLQSQFPAEELLDAGLFMPADKRQQQEFRPNSQFYGIGQKGKKAKEKRKNKDDRWEWGMVHPVIIPYFDESGRVIKLRPHKGGAPGNTLCGATRIYVPRDYRAASDTGEDFPRVVITEGEFKAAALWQVIGAGASKEMGTPWGVCAIPGINFAKTYDLRAELDAWLQAVQCRFVVVAFDDQDKSDKPVSERHDALIWARFLAADLARTLHIKAKVLVLPKSWRDDKGKADWDGALAGMISGKISTQKIS